MNEFLKGFKPLLAAPVDGEEDLKKLNYPVLVSPKIDGIRVLIHPELGPVTRSLKPVPNLFIMHILSKMPWGLDGEIVSGNITAPDVFNKTASAVMTHDGEPQFVFHVFDYFQYTDTPFVQRLEKTAMLVKHAAYSTYMDAIRLRLVDHHFCHSCIEVLNMEDQFITQGYEGIMIRDINGIYKFGRSTFKQGILLKMKRMQDDEAVIIGFEELYRNVNPAEINALGYTERSTQHHGMVPADTLGALLVEHKDFGHFRIGSGFDQATRDDFWRRRKELEGKHATFKYQKVGVVDKPRFPIFKGIREDI